MIIIEVDVENEKSKVIIEGKLARISAELVTAIKSIHDSMVKSTPSIYQNLAHFTVVESVKMALDLIDD